MVTHNNNDLEVAHLQSGSSSTWFLVELEFGNVGFEERGKVEYLEKNLSEQRREPTTNSIQIRKTWKIKNKKVVRH